MTKLPFALSAAFLLSACSNDPIKDIAIQVMLECDGPAGHAEIVRNRWVLGDRPVLVFDGTDSSHHEYKISISAPYDDGEMLAGENGMRTACITGAPDPRWREIQP